MATTKRVQTPQMSQVGRSITYRQLDTARGVRFTQAEVMPSANLMSQGLEGLAQFGARLSKQHKEEEEARLTEQQQAKAREEALTVDYRMKQMQNEWEAAVTENPALAYDEGFQKQFSAKWTPTPEGVTRGELMDKKWQLVANTMMTGFFSKASAEKALEDKRATTAQWVLTTLDDNEKKIASLSPDERAAARQNVFTNIERVYAQLGMDKAETKENLKSVAAMMIRDDRHNRGLAEWAMNNPDFDPTFRMQMQKMVEESNKLSEEEKTKWAMKAHDKFMPLVRQGKFRLSMASDWVNKGYITDEMARSWDNQSFSRAEQAAKDAAKEAKELAQVRELSLLNAVDLNQRSTKEKEAVKAHFWKLAQANNPDDPTKAAQEYVAQLTHKGLNMDEMKPVLSSLVGAFKGPMPLSENDLHGLAHDALKHPVLKEAMKSGLLRSVMDAKDYTVLSRAFSKVDNAGKLPLQAAQEVHKLSHELYYGSLTKDEQKVVKSLLPEGVYANPDTAHAALLEYRGMLESGVSPSDATKKVQEFVLAEYEQTSEGSYVPKALAVQFGADNVDKAFKYQLKKSGIEGATMRPNGQTYLPVDDEGNFYVGFAVTPADIARLVKAEEDEMVAERMAKEAKRGKPSTRNQSVFGTKPLTNKGSYNFLEGKTYE